MSWIYKNRRRPNSPDVRQILNHRSLGITLYLFVRKNHAGADNSRSDSRRETFHEFYFLGKITPRPDVTLEQVTVDPQQGLAAVRIEFLLEKRSETIFIPT